MKKEKIILLLKLCAFTVFLGRAYQLYFFGAPFRAILWDESLLTPIVEDIFNRSWFDYATSQKVNLWIDNFTRVCSYLFFMSALLCLFWDQIKFHKLKKIVLGLGIVVFLGIAICMMKDKNFDVFQLFELTIQFAAPLVILYKDSIDFNNKRLINILKVTIACTFVVHGLFAMGLFVLPGYFIDMTIKILHVTEDQATAFLFVAGMLDVVTSVFIFVPRLAKYALFYMAFWGFATALARVFAGYSSHFVQMSLHNSVFLTVYRLSHGLLPLTVLYLEDNFRKQLIIQHVDEI